MVDGSTNMYKKILLLDIKGKLYKFRLYTGSIDIHVNMNMDVLMPDMIISGLRNETEDSVWEVFISLRDNDSMRSLLQLLTTEFYKDKDMVFKFNIINGFKPDAYVLIVSRKNIVNGVMTRSEEIGRIPITNMKLKRSTPW